MDNSNNGYVPSNVNDSVFATQPVNNGLVGLDQNTQATQVQAEPQGNLVVDHSNITDDQNLNTIKEKALNDLSPILKTLEQTPEEKFHTTMMMIQASDDKSLIPEAYEAANQITNEKARAQALLDLINEINYFTHSKK